MATLCYENVWLEKSKYEEAEKKYYESQSMAALTPLAGEIAKARQRLLEIRCNFDEPKVIKVEMPDAGVKYIEKKFAEFEKLLISLQDRIGALDARVEAFENQMKEGHVLPTHSIDIKGNPNQSVEREEKVKKDDDDDVDLFGSDSEEESETAAKVREERLAAYNAKKSKKPALIAKSNIILDVKPWDDETDMVAMEAAVRKIEMDGLLWGAAKLVPLAYGIHKLQISCVVEDDKVSIDLLQEQIEALEDFVQSIDIAAFNKV